MKFILSCLLLSLIATTVAAQTDPLGWIEFAPEGGGFSILFPSKPVENISQKTAYTLYSFTTTAGRGTYVATYTDYTEVKAEPAAFLTANRDRFIKGMQATLIASREITLDGHTGLEFTGETPAANIKSQLFLVGKRLFQTATMVFKDVDQTRYVDHFFESFKFTKPPAPQP
jgi:hypothetical protein